LNQTNTTPFSCFFLLFHSSFSTNKRATDDELLLSLVSVMLSLIRDKKKKKKKKKTKNKKTQKQKKNPKTKSPLSSM
jgi:hypothetical protein